MGIAVTVMLVLAILMAAAGLGAPGEAGPVRRVSWGFGHGESRQNVQTLRGLLPVRHGRLDESA